jgi:hypothetical protein
LDDIEGMDKAQLLDVIHLGLMKHLARVLSDGTATNQDVASARAFLKDSKVITPTDDDQEDDGDMPPKGEPMPLPGPKYPNEYDHDE